MKHVLLFITTIITMVLSAVAPAQTRSQQERTVRSEMEVIHQAFGVNFVFDSSIDLNIPCRAIPDADRASLELCLETLFKGTEIDYEIMKKYIVLTQADKRRKPKDYTIFIEEQHDTIDQATVTAYINRRHNATQTGLTVIDGIRFRKGYAVLGSPDLIKEIQNQAGVSGGTELLSGLYVHGGDGTDNLFLIDGVPLYQVSHMLGLISSFNTEVVDNIDFYKSGFPSRYGGKLSSVVDVTTRLGDMNEFHGSFNIGLLNGGLQFEGPIVPGRTSFNVAVRRSWFDVITIPLNAIYNMTTPYGDTGRINYGMTDFNASVTHLFDKDNRLSLNVYAGTDKVTYKWKDLMVRYWEGTRYTGYSGYDMDVRWGNVLTSLNWDRKFSDNLHLNTVMYYVRTNSGVGMIADKWKMNSYAPDFTDLTNTDRNYSEMHDIGSKAELDWMPSEYHHINTGLSFVGHLFRTEREYSNLKMVNGQLKYSENDSFSNGYNASEMSAYLSDEISPVSWFKANLGLRYNCFTQGGYTHHSFEPRAALRLQLSPMTALKLSYTEMSQAVHLLRANYLDIPMATWVPSSSKVPPMRSKQVAGGIYLNLPHNLNFNVEGYWKTMSDLYEYCGIDGVFPDLWNWENELIPGKGRSYGAEVEGRWRTGNMDIAAYYTLSWTERYFEGIWHDWYPARNDNRHKFTLTATRKFSDRFEMYLGWHYHTGDRATVPTQTLDGQTYYTSPYNYKLSDYHRLDLGFNFHRTTKRGNESIWNLTLYNAYCRMNPLFSMLDYYKPSDSNEYKLKFVEAAAIPVIPSFNYTLRF